MIRYTVRLADCVISVSAIFESTKRYCASYLTEGSPDFEITIQPGDIAFERSKCAREDALEGRTIRRMTDTQLEITAVQRKIAEKLFTYDTILLHGSVVAVDGAAYLFTAKSGTGKSTHTALWCDLLGNRAVMVNDDKPFLRVTEDGILAYGSPWNGKHGRGSNICVPLKAICILERGTQNQIRPIDAKEALFTLLQQTNRPMDPVQMPKYLELIDRLTKQMSFYRMACNMDPEAARMAYGTMSGQENGV